MTYAAAVLRRCDELAAFSEEEGRLTRRFATPALWQAGETVRAWMEAAGMAVRRDAIGNVIGRLGDDDRRTLLIGSHLDTVRDAGRYDGMLGVLVAIACLERLRDEGRSLPYAVEVLAFADEEGVRYGTGYLGSSVVAGRFDAADLERRDADGVTLADAVRAFGGDPDRLASARRDPADLIGYYEVHIEQGPVLEAGGRPARRRHRDRRAEPGPHHVHRRSGPCGYGPDGAAPRRPVRGGRICERRRGGRPRSGRRGCDRRRARGRDGASNVIPGRVVLSLDVRHAADSVRESVVTRLRERAGAIADARGVAVRRGRSGRTLEAVDCSPALTELVAEAVAASGHPVVRLPSGAGHDAVMLSTIAPVAMLFVRCAGGVSHNPAESVTVEDVAAAIDATTRFLELVG